MPRWVTYAQAADILGCHVSNVSKLVRKGQLSSRSHGNRRLPALDRREVEQLAQRRSEPRRTTRSRAVDRRPDREHDWVSPREAGQVLGISKPAVLKRIHREALPAVENGGRFWVRRDHLDLVANAKQATRARHAGVIRQTA